jgi:hypothetical protein
MSDELSVEAAQMNDQACMSGNTVTTKMSDELFVERKAAQMNDQPCMSGNTVTEHV